MLNRQSKKLLSLLGLASLVIGVIFAINTFGAIAKVQTTSSPQVITYPVVTALTAGVLAILQSLLMLAVGMKRLKYSQGVGDGGREDLARAVRRHGNLAENAAIFLVVLALLETSSVSRLFVMIVAGLFVLARISHAIAFSITTGPHPLRVVGASLTVLLTIVSGGYLIWTIF